MILAKKSKVRNIKNVLVSPLHLSWSEKNEEDISSVQNALKELLPTAKLDSRTLPKWSKTSRKSSENFQIKAKERHENIYRSYLTPGFQSVIRGLEHNELCCIVLSNNITPILLLKTLLACAHTNNVPILVIPELKPITESALGFKAMVLGFKNIVAESLGNKFHPIYQMVSHNRIVFETPFIKPKENIIIDAQEKFSRYSQPGVTKKESLYLIRRKNSERMFIPKNKTRMKHSLESNTQNHGDFLYLEENRQAKTKIKTVNKMSSSYNHDSYDDNDDDDDDGDDVSYIDEEAFFFDKKADESLLNIKKLHLDAHELEKRSQRNKPQQTNNFSEIKQNKYTKNQFHNTNQKQTPPNLKNLNLVIQGKYHSKNGSKVENKNERQTHHTKHSLNSVSFKPLNTKSILSSCKNKKVKTKKKKDSMYNHLIKYKIN